MKLDHQTCVSIWFDRCLNATPYKRMIKLAIVSTIFVLTYSCHGAMFVNMWPFIHNGGGRTVALKLSNTSCWTRFDDTRILGFNSLDIPEHENYKTLLNRGLLERVNQILVHLTELYLIIRWCIAKRYV